VNLRWGVIGAIAVLLAACSSSPQKQVSRYSQQYDSAPTKRVDVKKISKIPNATPKYERRTRAGNKTPYKVLGKTYHVMPHSTGFRQTGQASWYGTKFHGHLTSNGERYDMYKMTAAHKTLPIPSYVKVVNKDNGRSVVVRVNDRGPFHHKRIIDLSYAAAIKLGYHNKGVANVEIFALEPDGTFASKDAKPTNKVKKGDIGYVQLAAFSKSVAAQELRDKVRGISRTVPVAIYSSTYGPDLYRVRIGPSKDKRTLEKWKKWVKKHLKSDAIVVWE